MPDDKRRPTAPTLPGVASAIDETLAKLDTHGRKLDEHTDAFVRVEETLLVHGHKIGALERGQAALRSTVTDHGERIIDLERKPPRMTPSQARDSIPPQVAALGKESQSGSWTWDAEAMSRVVVGMREQLDALEEEKRVSSALAAQRERDAAEAERRSTRLRGWLAVTIAGLVMLGAAFAFLAPRLASAPAPVVSAPAR